MKAKVRRIQFIHPKASAATFWVQCERSSRPHRPGPLSMAEVDAA